MDKETKEQLSGFLTGLLVLLVIAITIAIPITALIVSFDYDKVTDLQEPPKHISEIRYAYTDGLYIVGEAEGDCCMPSCDHEASAEIYYKFSHGAKRKVNQIVRREAQLSKKANFMVQSSIAQSAIVDSRTKKEDYIQIRPDGYGGFVASEEEYEYVEKFYGGTQTDYSCVVRGEYCSEHIEKAKEILIEEVERGVKTDPLYAIFVMLLPWNICILPCIAIFLFSWKNRNPMLYDHEATKRALVRIILPALVLVTIAFYVCRATDSLGLKYTVGVVLLVGTGVGAAFLGNVLGNR